MQEAVAQANARAARPLAVSAPSWWFVAGASVSVEPEGGNERKDRWPGHSFFGGFQNAMFGKALVALRQVTACSVQIQALRSSSAKPNARSRAGTSCCAARAGGVRLLAGDATQRTMRAGSVPQHALPNPSIERTSPGKPGAASHLKR
jgi:hypothetical protein